MQGKGFIKFMAILLGIVCLYSLSFNIITYNVEKKAKAFANGDEVKERVEKIKNNKSLFNKIIKQERAEVNRIYNEYFK